MVKCKIFFYIVMGDAKILSIAILGLQIFEMTALQVFSCSLWWVNFFKPEIILIPVDGITFLSVTRDLKKIIRIHYHHYGETYHNRT